MRNVSHEGWTRALGRACRVGVLVALLVPFSGCATAAKKATKKAVTSSVDGAGRSAKATATVTKKTGKAAVGAAGAIVNRDEKE